MPEKEYIEREAAITTYKTFGHLNLHNALEAFKEIPAADVRPVVYCRECKHYKPQKKSARWENKANMCTRSVTIKMPPDGFCSFGVKGEER